MSAIILYESEDHKSRIQLRAEGDTVWLSQLEMAELFSATKQNISLHLKNLFADGELAEDSVVKESLTTAADGKDYRTKLYNLDAILAVGYRVRSPRGVQFRRWASTVLKEYLAKGFVIDDERLKNPDGRPDHFDEMLARIRDIRASEKRFYQKIRDLFALSTETTMRYWRENVAEIITSNGFPLLQGAGSMSNELMEQNTAALYTHFDQRRKHDEAIQADQADEAELKSLEQKIKRRPKK